MNEVANTVATLYVLDPPWRQQAADIYKAAERELTKEMAACDDPKLKSALGDRVKALKDPGTREAVMEFGGAMRSTNSNFVPVLQEILRKPQEGIPEPLLAVMHAGLVWREKSYPAIMERDPAMRQDLTTLLQNGKTALESNPPGAAAAALSAATRYNQSFARRHEAAGEHLKSVLQEVGASPQSAVQWCETFSSFTPQEVLPHGIDTLHETMGALADGVRSDGGFWTRAGAPPAAGSAADQVVKAAAAVIGATDSYISNGMPSLTAAVAPVNDAIAAFRVVAPASVPASVPGAVAQSKVQLSARVS